MRISVWALATLAAILVGILVTVVTRWVPGGPRIRAEISENACAIRCPAATPYPSVAAGVTCAAGQAPRCQCVSAQTPQASCVPLN